MKKMKLETEIIFSEFKEKYDDFVASEAELGR
jgi:hypothetical protein